MKCLSSILAGVVLCAVATAQEASAPPNAETTPQVPASPANSQAAQPTAAQSSSALRLAPGSVIPVELTKTIDAKKAKTGDEVTAKVTQDMKAVNGEVLVAKDTKVAGHVTEAQARTKEQKQSQVGIAFDRVITTQGNDSLPMSIQAIIAPSSLNTNNANSGSAGSAGNERVGGTSPGYGSGRSSGMGTGMPPQAPSYPTAASSGAGGQQTQSNGQQPLTGSTQGVVGISNLTLSTTGAAAQGSLVSSDKNNVKLDRGTRMLLRVNQ